MDTNTQTQVLDPYAAADAAQPMARAYYGQLQLDIWFCALVKGQGKVPYDPQIHKQRATAVNISLLPIAEQNVNFELRREIIAESHEWAGITWASLKALGLTSTRDANNRWVKLIQVPSGRKYRNSSGEEKESTAFKFVALYADESACRSAYLSETGKADEDEAGPAQAPLAAEEPNQKLKVAVPFIEAFAKQHNYDLEKTKTACRPQPMIANAVDIDSPEFAQIVLDAAIKAVTRL